MQAYVVHSLRGAALAALLCSPAARAQQDPAVAVLQQKLDAMQRQLAEQRSLIDAMGRELAARRTAPPGAATEAVAQAAPEAATQATPEAVAEAVAEPTPVAAQTLDEQRGAGNLVAALIGSGAVTAGAGLLAANQPAPPASPAAPGRRGPPPASAPGVPAAAAGSVGRPPSSNGRPPEVAPLFEQPGVLTPKGKFVFEPAFQFGYSSSNRVALVGYTVIPALLIGLVDVREIKRNTATAIFSGRYGLGKRLEIEARVPYVYRSDSTVSREIFTGTAVENVFSTSGKGMGDAELALRYQLNQGGPDRPYYVGSLRLKSRTGRDPFEVVIDCTRRCIGTNASGTGLPLDLPTGSGFYSIQPGMTWLFPTDPAVLFGSVSYLHNIKRSNVSRTVLGGEQEFLGDVEPGDIIGFNLGMGLGLNDKASLSIGYDHSAIARTRQGGLPVPGSVRTQLGTLLLGFSYRISAKRSLNVAIGAGLTRDTPDVSLTVRIPTTF